MLLNFLEDHPFGLNNWNDWGRRGVDGSRISPEVAQRSLDVVKPLISQHYPRRVHVNLCPVSCDGGCRLCDHSTAMRGRGDLAVWRIPGREGFRLERHPLASQRWRGCGLHFRGHFLFAIQSIQEVPKLPTWDGQTHWPFSAAQTAAQIQMHARFSTPVFLTSSLLLNYRRFQYTITVRYCKIWFVLCRPTLTISVVWQKQNIFNGKKCCSVLVM